MTLNNKTVLIPKPVQNTVMGCSWPIHNVTVNLYPYHNKANPCICNWNIHLKQSRKDIQNSCPGAETSRYLDYMLSCTKVPNIFLSNHITLPEIRSDWQFVEKQLTIFVLQMPTWFTICHSCCAVGHSPHAASCLCVRGHARAWGEFVIEVVCLNNDFYLLWKVITK